MTGQKIRLHILSGYLGSGKTSFLAQLLSLPQMANSAIIINEFGEFSLDHLLIDYVEEDVYQLANGCLCCSNNNELSDRLIDLSENQKNPNEVPKRVIIETTGIADTQNLLGSLLNNPVIQQRYQLSNSIVIVSATDFLEQEDLPAETENQIATADKILISKADLLGPKSRDSQIAHLMACIESYNAHAKIELLPLNQEQYSALFDTLPIQLPEHVKSPHSLSHYRSTLLKWDRPIETNRIRQVIELLIMNFSEEILRIKGLGFVVEHPEQPLVIQVAGNQLTPFSKLENWREQPANSITIIHKDSNGNKYRNLFNGFLDIPDIDQPDRNAMIDNPLSIPGMGKF